MDTAPLANQPENGWWWKRTRGAGASYSGTWWQYANGQALTGTYRPAERINSNVAPVTIQFQGADLGIMTLPGNRTTAIKRYRF